jgi:hypothetical protein
VILDNHLTHNNNFSKLKGYGNKINFVLFERTFKVIYEDPLQLFRTLLAWFSKYFDQKQCAVRHLGIIIDLVN